MILYSCNIDNQRKFIHWNRSDSDTHPLIRSSWQLDDSAFMQYKTIKGSLYIGLGLILIHILKSNLLYNLLILHSCSIDNQRKSIHWNISDIVTHPLIRPPLQLDDSASCNIDNQRMFIYWNRSDIDTHPLIRPLYNWMILHSCSIDNQRKSIHWNTSYIDTHPLIRPPLQLTVSAFMQYKTIKGSLYIGIGLILIHIL